MPTKVLESSPFHPVEIALWGPTGVGKDWLISAFVKELDYFNQENHDFIYEIGIHHPGDPNPIILQAEPPSNVPTTHSEDIRFFRN